MSNQQVFWRLFGFVRPISGLVAVAVLLGVATVGSSIALMSTSAWLISRAAQHPDIGAISIAVVGVRAFGISRAVFRYLERLVSHHITFKLLAEFRVWFYKAIEPLAPAGLSGFRSGDLLGRVVSDVESLQEFYIRVVAPPLVGLITLLAMFFFFLILDPMAALVLVLFMTIGGTALPLYAWWRAHNPGATLVAQRAALNASLVDGIQGMADAVAYGHAKAQIEQFYGIQDELTAQEHHLARLNGIQEAGGLFIVNIASLLVLAVAIPRVDGIYLATLALGTVAAFEAITPLAVAAIHLGTTLAAGKRLFAITDTIPPVEERAIETPTFDSMDIVFEAVTFRYRPTDPPALDQLSLAIPEGRKIAVVGPTGAGKSSLMNVLLRFWDYESGAITLDQLNLRDIHSEDLREQIAVMSQRTHLFNTTIRENIGIARNDATEDEIIEAARQAQIHDFILGLPDGYRTIVGEGGANLSGGERQRIALARALLKNAPILILDEATANLDAVTERAILSTVYATTQNRTLIVITHRLTMLDQLDEVVVLDRGRIVQQGTHADLVTQDGLYRQLWESQARLFATV